MSTLPPMKRGDTPTWRVTALDADGAPFNLTGWTMRLTAKRSVDDSDADAVFQLSTVDGTIVYTDAAGGIADATPLRSATSGLTTDITVFWDVQVAIDGASDLTHTLDSGQLQIVRDVTRTAP